MRHVKTFENWPNNQIVHLASVKENCWYVVPSYVTASDRHSDIINLEPGDLIFVDITDGRDTYFFFKKEVFSFDTNHFMDWFDSDINQQPLAKPHDHIQDYISAEERRKREHKVFGNSKSAVKYFGRITPEEAKTIQFERRGQNAGKKFGF